MSDDPSRRSLTRVRMVPNPRGFAYERVSEVLLHVLKRRLPTEALRELWEVSDPEQDDGYRGYLFAHEWTRRWRLTTDCVGEWAAQQLKEWGALKCEFWTAVRRRKFRDISTHKPPNGPAHWWTTSPEYGALRDEGYVLLTERVRDDEKIFAGAAWPWSQLPITSAPVSSYSPDRGDDVALEMADLEQILDAYPPLLQLAEAWERGLTRAQALRCGDVRVSKALIDSWRFQRMDTATVLRLRSGDPLPHDPFLDGPLTDLDVFAARPGLSLRRQSKKEYLEYCARTYDARVALLSVFLSRPLTPATEPRELERHCDWLVRVRVLGHSIVTIAKEMTAGDDIEKANQEQRLDSARRNVNDAVVKLERLFELAPIRRPGRPRGARKVPVQPVRVQR